MALIQSSMIKLGTKFSDFELENVITNQKYNTNSIENKVIVLMFICVHCPFVKHINVQLGELSQIYKSKEVQIIAINSNDIKRYADDSEEFMKKQSNEFNFEFPYLLDESQEIAKLYDAQCTPDFYVFDKNRELVYRGQFDESRPNNGIIVTGNDIINAINQTLNSEQIINEQIPSIGCNIKWKL